MEKIEKLTPEQESKLEVYKEKWINIGLDTNRFTKEQTESIINPFYEKILQKKQVPVYIFENPIKAWNGVLLLNIIKNDSIKIDPKIKEKIQEELNSGIFSKDQQELLDSINPKIDFINPYIYGSFDSWYSFYDYFDNEVFKLEKRDLFYIVTELSKLGLTWCCDEFCVVCQKPSLIKMVDGKLHCEDGPAIMYDEDFKVYSLNGVRVPEYLVMTRAEDLSMDFFMKEKNADIKAEFVRKYGIDRMVSMGKAIDTWENYKSNEWWVKSEYELIDMAPIFTNIKYAPHVKMKNQTTMIYHLEAVPPTIKNLKEAMDFRHGGRKNLDTIVIK